MDETRARRARFEGAAQWPESGGALPELGLPETGLPEGGLRRLAALWGVAAVPFFRAFDDRRLFGYDGADLDALAVRGYGQRTRLPDLGATGFVREDGLVTGAPRDFEDGGVGR